MSLITVACLYHFEICTAECGWLEERGSCFIVASSILLDIYVPTLLLPL